MNLRQAQRSLAELISKCEASHIQLPQDPLEARAEGVESIIHSLKDGKPNLQEAQDELQQKYGIEISWKQKMENDEAKRQRRRESRQKKGVNRSKASTSVEFLPDAPAVDSLLETKASGSLGESHLSAGTVQKSTPKGDVMTPSKRSAASQKVPETPMKIAKKTRSARELTVPRSPGDSEDKPPSTSAATIGNILSKDNQDTNSSNESPNQGIVDLLDMEDLDEIERSGEMSSDEEFAL